MESPNTAIAIAKLPPDALPIRTTNGATVYVRIDAMRESYHDFLFDVYVGNWLLTCQIIGREYFNIDVVKRQFKKQCGIDLDLQTYQEWTDFVNKLGELFTPKAAKS